MYGSSALDVGACRLDVEFCTAQNPCARCRSGWSALESGSTISRATPERQAVASLCERGVDLPNKALRWGSLLLLEF